MLLIAAAFFVRFDDVGVYLFGFRWKLHCLVSHSFRVRCFWCGLIRCFGAMADGDFTKAFGLNRFGIILFGYLLWQIPYRLVSTIPMKRTRRIVLVKANIIATGFLLAAAGFLLITGGSLR